ncbi:MAG: fibronectin type III domain-containing protein [Flammeovirgaceae bacterium]|nr:fibronectin type III domain-containing protein [Flammeovirgaceae bacterium]
MKNFLLLIAITFIVPCFSVYSQELSESDQKEIKFLSEGFVGEFELLLNLLSDPDLGEYEKKEISENSYNPKSGNQIFKDADVIIEDDIDPNNTDFNKVKDLKIKRYLNDLELFYEKKSENSITFSDITLFSVKQDEYVYTEVYFKSKFNSKHRIKNTLYRQTERIATIKAERINSKWKPVIVSVVFYNPALHINEEIKKIPLDIPENIIANKQEITELGISWNPVANKVDSITYEIYMNNKLVGTTGEEYFEVTELESDTEYQFHIIAKEEKTERISEKSELTTLKTLPKPLVQSYSFTEIKGKYVKGKNYEITWANSLSGVGSKLEILQNGRLVNTISNNDPDGSFKWKPDLYNVGTGYQFRVSDPDDSRNKSVSKEFKISRKVPLWLKIAPVIAAGAIVGVLAFGSDGGGDNPNPGTDPITEELLAEPGTP